LLALAMSLSVRVGCIGSFADVSIKAHL
jgi:hypothetical protein